MSDETSDSLTAGIKPNKSPFPGMDPYLEGEWRSEFHQTLAAQIRAQLMVLLPASYVALLERYYLVDPSGVTLTQQGVYPDVHILIKEAVAPYYVFLSRFTRRPHTEIWPLQLRDPLPTVPVPLLPPDPDVPLALQTAINACFELVRYHERLLNYNKLPPPPPLSSEDTAWVKSVISSTLNL
jgi:hypothetical protein